MSSMANCAFLFLALIAAINCYVIVEQEEENDNFLFMNDRNELLSKEKFSGDEDFRQRYKRQAAKVDERDIQEYGRAGPYFLNVKVISSMSGQTVESIRAELQNLNKYFTVIETFIPRLHLVVDSITVGSDSLPSGGSITAAQDAAISSYAGQSGIDLAIVLTSKTYADQDTPTHLEWKAKNIKGKLCGSSGSKGTAIVVTPKSADARPLADGIAHEIGWALQMGLDICGGGGSCQETYKRYLMSQTSAFRGYYEDKWSQQSVLSYRFFVRDNAKTNAKCIFDKPPAGKVAICGNGIKESGEACDCLGYDTECQQCCAMASCQLTAGSQCFTGDSSTCCNKCKKVKKGDTCRPAANECDKEEKCDNQSKCPKDEFKSKSTSCGKGGKRAGSCDGAGVCVAGKPRGAAEAAESKKSNWWIILLIVLGAILVAVIIAYLIYWCIKRKRQGAGSAETTTTGGSTSGKSTTNTSRTSATSSKAPSNTGSKVPASGTGSKVPASGTGSKVPVSGTGSKAASATGSKTGSKVSGSKTGSKTALSKSPSKSTRSGSASMASGSSPSKAKS